jgi:Domain of unknown function (DUF4367)
MRLRRLVVIFLLTAFTLNLMQMPNKRIQAKEIKYNHNSIKIEELVHKIDFNVLIPERLPKDFSLEIKTYPDYIRLHIMDKEDQALLVGIEQRKASNTQSETTVQDAETVLINGNKGTFKTFSNAPGGILSWKQDGTFLVMDSHTATKQEMIEMARSMKTAE